MNMVDFGIVNSVKRLWTEFAQSRDDMRTEHAINKLPDYLLRDIGWPDAYAERLGRRNSMQDTAAGNDNAGAVRLPHLQRPITGNTGKTSQNGHLTLEY